MAYLWKPESGTFSLSDLADDGLVHHFETQEAAEDWLGLFYDELLDKGVEEVSLYEEDRLVYGPMQLRP